MHTLEVANVTTLLEQYPFLSFGNVTSYEWLPGEKSISITVDRPDVSYLPANESSLTIEIPFVVNNDS